MDTYNERQCIRRNVCEVDVVWVVVLKQLDSIARQDVIGHEIRSDEMR